MKELIILGKGPSMGSCPYDKEIWATSSTLELPVMANKDVSKVFAFDVEPKTTGLPIARERGIPIVSTKPYATEKFPYQEIVTEFHCAFFKPTVSYMIAYAVYLKYDKLYLFGVDQGPEWVHIAGRPYVTFWLGVAVGRGLEYRLAPTCLLRHAMDKHIEKRYKQLQTSEDWSEVARLASGPVFLRGKDITVIFKEQGQVEEILRTNQERNKGVCVE